MTPLFRSWFGVCFVLVFPAGGQSECYAGTSSSLDSLNSRPAYIGVPSFRLPSAAWRVAKFPAWSGSSSSPFRALRSGNSLAMAGDGDSAYAVLAPAVRTDGSQDPHTDTAITWLWSSTEPGNFVALDSLTMAAETTIASPLQTVRWEVDSLYYYGDRGLPYNNVSGDASGEGWYWTRLRGGNSIVVPIDLPLFTPTAGSSFLQLKLHSSSPAQVVPTHAIVVSINGQVIDTVRWNGYQSLVTTLSVPPSVLVRGQNAVTLRSLSTGASVNEVYVDWIEIGATQELSPGATTVRLSVPVVLTGRKVRFQVQSGPNDSILVFRTTAQGSIDRWLRTVNNGSSWEFIDSVRSDRTYIICRVSSVRRDPLPSPVVVEDLRQRSVPADYLIITPREFASAAMRLAAHRAAHNARLPAVVTAEDIFDNFGHGQWGPDAIREFIVTTDRLWPAPAPRYILLFGDGSWDPKDLLRSGKRGMLPTLGNPVSDALYVVDTLDQFKPTKAIGRIPVRTATEADSVVHALIDYDFQPVSGWNSRFLFFASGFDSLETLRFQQFSDALFSQYLALAPIAGTQARIYRTVNQVVDFEQTEEVRRLLDSGAVWINYYGHAGTDVWANGINSADQLANVEGKAHLITDISCSTARFGEPLVESFGELMVRSTESRAFAYVGSSGFGYETPLRTLAQGFFRSFNLGVRSLGDLHLAAKEDLWKGGTASLTTQQALQQWTLLGDPAANLRIARWPEWNLSDHSTFVLPAEPTEKDSVVRVVCEIRNLGLLTNDSVVVRVRLSSDVSTIEFDERIPASRRLTQFVIDRPELRAPGFHVVSVAVNPDSLAAEESLTKNRAEIRYVVSSSRFRILAPLERSRQRPDSLYVKVLQPLLASPGQSLEWQIDTAETFDSPVSRSWQNIPVTPWATTYRVPPPALLDSAQYVMRARLTGTGGSSGWFETRFSTGDPMSWMDDRNTGFSGTEVSALRRSPSIVLEERDVPVSVFSAGFSDGLDARIVVAGTDISQGFVTRGYNVATIDERSGDLVSFAGFSLYSDPADTMFAEPLIQFLGSIPIGRRVLIGIADEGQRNKTERLNKALEAIGSAAIRTLGFRGSWAISGWKGAPIGSVPEAISASGQGPVTVFDTLRFVSDTGRAITPVIGPAARWRSLSANISDTTATARVLLKAVRHFADGTTDTVAFTSGPVNPVLFHPGVHSIQLIADFQRQPGQPSPALHGWSVDFDSPAEPAFSPALSRLDTSTVDAGTDLRAVLPVANVGSSDVDTLEYRIQWRWNSTTYSLAGRLFDLRVGEIDTIFSTFPTGTVSGPVTMEGVLDPNLKLLQWERGNDLIRLTAFVLPDTVKPSFNISVDGRQIVDGDYVRPHPTIQIDISDNSEVPIESPSNIVLRVNGRRVALSTGTPDSLFESNWNERRASVTYKPSLPKGTHILGIQVTDGSGNPADTSEFLLSMRVETEASLKNVVAFPNPFPSSTDLTFNLTGQDLPEEGTVRIHTVAGRLIRELRINAGSAQTGFNAISWDGLDAEGDEVANGVYLAVLKVKVGEKWLQETAKLAKVR